jgi:hypothetical protein
MSKNNQLSTTNYQLSATARHVAVQHNRMVKPGARPSRAQRQPIGQPVGNLQNPPDARPWPTPDVYLEFSPTVLNRVESRTTDACETPVAQTVLSAVSPTGSRRAGTMGKPSRCTQTPVPDHFSIAAPPVRSDDRKNGEGTSAQPRHPVAGHCGILAPLPAA